METKKQGGLPDLSEEVTRFGMKRGAWRALMLAVFAFLALTGLFLSIAKGAADISLAQVWQILTNPQAAPADQIIWNIRLPRTIVGALVGVNLALSGAILQAIMRNPWQTRTSSAFRPARAWPASPS